MVILSHYYIKGRLVYMTTEIHCAYCDFVQPTKPVKNKFGYTQGFTVEGGNWQHGADCPQLNAANLEPGEETDE
jgi:hypothetical protein